MSARSRIRSKPDGSARADALDPIKAVCRPPERSRERVCERGRDEAECSHRAGGSAACGAGRRRRVTVDGGGRWVGRELGGETVGELPDELRGDVLNDPAAVLPNGA